MAEAVAALFALGQQLWQQQQGGGGGEQPTVCFAALPLLLPAAVIFARAAHRRLRRPVPRSA